MTLAVQCELSGSEMTGVSVHVVELKVPEEAGEALKVTVPEGFDFVPAALSSTCASQVEAWLRTTVLGEHVTVVSVARLLTVSTNPSGSVLAASSPSCHRTR